MNRFWFALRQQPKGLILVPRARNATTRRRVDAVQNLDGSARGFSERTNHSPRGCVASTERFFWGGRRTSGPRGGARRVRHPLALRQRGTRIRPWISNRRRAAVWSAAGWGLIPVVFDKALCYWSDLRTMIRKWHKNKKKRHLTYWIGNVFNYLQWRNDLKQVRIARGLRNFPPTPPFHTHARVTRAGVLDSGWLTGYWQWMIDRFTLWDIYLVLAESIPSTVHTWLGIIYTIYFPANTKVHQAR